MFNSLIDPRFNGNLKPFKPTVYSYKLGSTTVYTGRRIASTFLESIKSKDFNLPFKEIYLIREPNLRFVSGVASSIFHYKSFFSKINLNYDIQEEDSIAKFVSKTASLFPEVYLSDPHIHFYHNFLYDKFSNRDSQSFKVVDIDKNDLKDLFGDWPIPNSTNTKVKEQVLSGFKNISDSRAITTYNTVLSLELYYYKLLAKFI